jgi:hypothetical protein
MGEITFKSYNEILDSDGKLETLVLWTALPTVDTCEAESVFSEGLM